MQTRLTPPPVVFHGTSAAFDAFDPNPRGIFFAERYSGAAPYARIRAGGARRVMAAALTNTNPWVQIAYADDVPYSMRIDQSVAAVAARVDRAHTLFFEARRDADADEATQDHPQQVTPKG